MSCHGHGHPRRFGVLRLRRWGVAVGSTMPGLAAVVEGEAAARRRLIVFRAGLYACLRRRADALFELADAVLTRTGPAGSLVELSGEKAFRRGHGALYDALACGDIDEEALGGLLARSWEVPDEGPLKIAVDVSPWPRPDAETSEGRCHAYASCRCDGARKTIPGWPYSFAAGLEWGATSWTALLDAVRTGPQDSASTVTAAQVGRVHRRLAAAGLLAGRPAAVFVFDSGYDLTRIAYLTSHDGVPAQVLGRVRSDRVFYGPAPQRLPPPGRGSAAARGAFRPGQTRRPARPRPASGGWQRPLRAGAGQRLARTAPATVPRRELERARRRTAHRPRHRDPPSGRPPARQPHPQRPVAMAPRPARHPLRSGPAVEDLPATLRS